MNNSNIDNIKRYNDKIAYHRQQLEALSIALINMLKTVDIEYIDFYAIMNSINNHTTNINKLEYLISLEYK